MDGPFRVVIGGLELLGTGSVLSYGYQPVDIYPVDRTYHVSVSYETNEDTPPAIILNQSFPQKTIVRAINFNRGLGLASGAPVHVANWNGRKLYFIFSCHLIGELNNSSTVRHTAFSFYLGEAI